MTTTPQTVVNPTSYPITEHYADYLERVRAWEAEHRRVYYRLPPREHRYHLALLNRLGTVAARLAASGHHLAAADFERDIAKARSVLLL